MWQCSAWPAAAGRAECRRKKCVCTMLPARVLTACPAPPPAGNFSPRTDAKAVWHMLTSSYLNIMLICLPIGLWAGITGANPTLIFTMVRCRSSRVLLSVCSVFAYKRVGLQHLDVLACSAPPMLLSDWRACFSPHLPAELPVPHPAGAVPGGGHRRPGGAVWRHSGRPAERDVWKRGGAVSP